MILTAVDSTLLLAHDLPAIAIVTCNKMPVEINIRYS